MQSHGVLCLVKLAKAKEKQINHNKHPHHNCMYLITKGKFQTFQILTK